MGQGVRFRGTGKEEEYCVQYGYHGACCTVQPVLKDHRTFCPNDIAVDQACCRRVPVSVISIDKMRTC